ncbi:MAG: hypothetical protein KDJ41_17400 [Hyphomicrobiaceae bacterium]|nr:hypothetical protein [Hyphomicrobiaceae bacterium]
MTASFYQGKVKHDDRMLLMLSTLNGLFAMTVLFAWTLIAMFVAEPVSWATWHPMSAASRPEVYDYPFVMLWAMPIAGMSISWAAQKIGNRQLAHFILCVPLLVLGLMVGWYHFAPVAWR